MKHFTGAGDVADVHALVQQAIDLKKMGGLTRGVGNGRTLGMIFLNPSLRTRISTQRAAQNLGMSVIVVNITADGWALEFEDGAVMNGTKVEHVKDAAAMLGLYCDVIAVRCFPSLTDRDADYEETLLQQFIKHSGVPVVSMESATRHPLQSLADMMAIAENKAGNKPKVVLCWAPHIKPLPQAVSNSFAEWAIRAGYDLTIAHPPGYELADTFTNGATITHDQDVALKGADFVYVKNWSSYKTYGHLLPVEYNWLLNEERLASAPNARIMHCLPVRRNVELSDELLDGPRSLIQEQAMNRVYAAQAVLQQILS